MICLLALAAPIWAQDRVNRFDTPEGVQQGNALFQIHCTYCHGARGEGGRGADLTTGRYRRGGSDANLFDTIRNGIPGTEMPVVRASDDEVWKMVAFVKNLGARRTAREGFGRRRRGEGRLSGEGQDAPRAIRSAARVEHSVPTWTTSGGGAIWITSLESLLKPDADVAVRYRAVAVTTKSGQTITGIRLNEDDISIQLRDEKDNLRSFFKDKLSGMRYDKPSLMPAYGTVLSKKEIDDVVSYLSSLRGVQ